MVQALKPVESSMIAATGYDPASRTLAVHFRNGTAMHHFRDVPPEVAAGLDSAESAGRYFNANIRGKFDVEQVPLEATEGAAS